MDFLNQLFFVPVAQLPFWFLAALLAFTVHEFSHAYLAYRFGDPSAKREGRVTLNPRAHVDILGMLLVLLAGIGWAKPVPVNHRHFKYPRLMGIAVAFAGPLSNLLFGFLLMIFVYVLVFSGVLEGLSGGLRSAFSLFFNFLIYLNIILFLLNLIPLPPLDGYRVAENVLPAGARNRLARIEPWAVYIFLLLIFIPPLYRVTIGPIMALSGVIIEGMNAFLYRLFG